MAAPMPPGITRVTCLGLDQWEQWFIRGEDINQNPLCTSFYFHLSNLLSHPQGICNDKYHEHIYITDTQQILPQNSVTLDSNCKLIWAILSIQLVFMSKSNFLIVDRQYSKIFFLFAWHIKLPRPPKDPGKRTFFYVRGQKGKKYWKKM